MKRPHAHLTVNFGQKPFVFDIDGMMSVSIQFCKSSRFPPDMRQREKQHIHNEIDKTNVSTLHPTLGKEDLCRALVAQYLSHDGYVETAKAFASEVRAESTALTGRPEPKLEDYLSMEEDHDAMHRQRAFCSG